MRTLLLLRHAKASHGPGHADDHERPLTERGRGDALRLGRFLKTSSHLLPDTILCSDALRTRQTAEYLFEGYGAVPADVEYRRELYLADAGKLIGRIQECAAPSLMLIGHNPGLHRLALTLAGRDGSGHGALLREEFPTCALAAIAFPELSSWRDIAPGAGILQTFLTARLLAETV